MKLNRLILALMLTLGGFGWAQAQCTAGMQLLSNGACTFTAYDSSFVAPMDSIVSYDWNWGDGTTGSGMMASHTYSSSGWYGVCLTITTMSGCTSVTCDTAMANCSGTTCTAAFTDSTSVFGGTQFYDYSTASGGNITTWLWTFGDGTSSSLQNPVHSYASPGNYTVCLTIMTSLGCSDQTCTTITVGGGGGCSISYTATNNSGNTVNFTSNSTGSSPYTFFWDFGDGNTGTAANPIHTYGAPGVYMACVTLTDNNGCSSTYCDSLLVGNPAGGCSVGFTSTNTTGSTVDFSASASGTAPFTYVWDFGDGSTGTGANPQHTYASSGGYVACVTMSDAGGCTATFCDSVLAGGPILGGCQASFVWYPDSSGQYSVIVINTATGTNLNYFWDFGDGSSSTQAYPSHVYAGPGTYNVCLTVWNNTCADTTCQNITVINKVNVPFSINVVAQNPTAVEDELVTGVSIYPNPFGDRFELDLNLDRAEMVDIELVNIHGAVVGHLHQGQMAAGAHHLQYDAPALAAGLYLIRIKAGDQVHTQKLLHR